MVSVAERAILHGFSTVASATSRYVLRRNKIYLPSIAATLSFDFSGKPLQHNVVGVDVCAEHEELDYPIRFTAVGFGENLHAAGLSAAHQWFSVVFPVLRSLWEESPSAIVESATIRSADFRSASNFTWQVFLGPVRVVYRGDHTPPAADPTRIIQAITSDLSEEAASTIAFWLDAFVAVQDDNTVVADCRLANEQWPEGTQRLAQVAERILPPCHGFRSWRQFLFFRPMEPLPFAEPAEFRETRPWWKRLVPFHD